MLCTLPAQTAILPNVNARFHGEVIRRTWISLFRLKATAIYSLRNKHAQLADMENAHSITPNTHTDQDLFDHYSSIE